MFSQILFRFSKPNSCLLFLIFLSYFHHLPCALSQRDLRLCDTLFHCGNLTAGFPFWGDRRPESCGHPSLALHCDQSRNNTYMIISGQMYSVLQINNATNTLRLARQDFLGKSFCSATFTGTTLTPELFEPSSDYKSLFVYYLCDARFHNHAYFKCPKIGVASVHKNEENHENCGASFNITVPASYVPEENALNLTRLGSILKEGFKVKLKIDDRRCQECQSSGGICGYDVGTTVCCKTNSSSGSLIGCIPIIPSRSSGFSLKAKTGGFSLKAKTGIGLASGVVVVILVAGGLFCAISWLKKTSYDRKQQKLKALIPLKHYSYAQVKRMTKSFAEVVGKGGFGTVYRGTLCDGRSVAVKVLKESKSDGEEFINEVASMSKTSHVNIVSLLGFCSDGSQRAIIYEFVENGSLDKFISSNTSMKLGVEVLYGIALGVARGLEYLHYGCKTRIVHFDIKPSNVLLDKNLCPKVSDFGLAKLCEKKESIMSLLDTRGTIGYIAPEMISRVYGNVSHKSDVYSYGMLVLEMIGARNKTSTENSASDPSSMYFPEWIYKDLEKGYGGRPIENGISSEEEEISKTMTLVGLWCIQSSPSNRPPMNKVVEMMDGSLEALEVPPRPVLQQIPAGPFQESSLLSDNISLTSFDDILMFSNDFPSH